MSYGNKPFAKSLVVYGEDELAKSVNFSLNLDTQTKNNRKI